MRTVTRVAETLEWRTNMFQQLIIFNKFDNRNEFNTLLINNTITDGGVAPRCSFAGTHRTHRTYGPTAKKDTRKGQKHKKGRIVGRMQNGPNVGLRAFGAQAIPSLLDLRSFLNLSHFLI